jgi:single-strand DNA-binding protein
VSINVIVIAGRLGQKPMLKKLAEGKQVTDFRLAHQRRKRRRESGDDERATDWYTCNLWGPLAEVLCTEGLKGQKITVTGTLSLENVPVEGGATRLHPVIEVTSFELGPVPPLRPKSP